jgi:O-antigen ligase
MSRDGGEAGHAVAALADRWIEAGWLAALALVPLYVGFFSARPYTVGKEYLLRFLVILMAGAWAMRLGATGWPPGGPDLLGLPRRGPALPVAAYAAAVLVATAASIAPALSFRGSLAWLQGASTTLTHVAFFALLASGLRTPAQVGRVLTLVPLASLPVALYAIAQQLGWDPLVHAGPPDIVRWRARSTLGNHVFLGGYLVMVMPLTAAHLLGALARRRDAPRPAGPGDAWRLGASLAGQVLLLAAVLVATVPIPALWWVLAPVLVSYLLLALSSAQYLSRAGPGAAATFHAGLLLLQAVALALSQARGAWLAAMAGAVVFGALVALRQRAYRRLAGVAAAAVLAGLFVAALNAPLGALAPLRRVALLDRLGSLSAFESDAIRDRLLLWRTAGRLMWTRPDVGGAPDPLGPGRVLVGYGPETFRLAAEPTLPAPLARGESWQRVHTHVHNDLLQHLDEMGVLGLAAFLVLVGAFYRLALGTLRERGDPAGQRVLIALVAAMTAHLAELQFGLGITSTRLLFWTYLALAVALSRPAPGEVAAPEPVLRPAWIRRQLALAAVLALAGATVLSSRDVAGLWLGLAGLTASLLMVALALGPAIRPAPRGLAWWPAAVAAAVAGLAFYGTIRPLAAHAYYRLGEFEAGWDRPGTSLAAYQAAARLYPRDDAYRVALGQAYARLGSHLAERPASAPAPPGRALVADQALVLAEEALQEARRLQPLDARHVFHLAQLNHAWGLRGRPERLARALDLYREAAAMSPNRLAVRVGWSLAHLANREPARALEQIRGAQSLGHESWAIHYALALAYDQTGRRDLAAREAGIAARARRGGEPLAAIPGIEDRDAPRLSP